MRKHKLKIVYQVNNYSGKTIIKIFKRKNIERINLFSAKQSNGIISVICLQTLKGLQHARAVRLSLHVLFET